jgi:hypothetical protein
MRALFSPCLLKQARRALLKNLDIAIDIALLIDCRHGITAATTAATLRASRRSRVVAIDQEFAALLMSRFFGDALRAHLRMTKWRGRAHG